MGSDFFWIWRMIPSRGDWVWYFTRI